MNTAFINHLSDVAYKGRRRLLTTSESYTLALLTVLAASGKESPHGIVVDKFDLFRIHVHSKSTINAHLRALEYKNFIARSGEYIIVRPLD